MQLAGLGEILEDCASSRRLLPEADKSAEASAEEKGGDERSARAALTAAALTAAVTIASPHLAAISAHFGPQTAENEAEAEAEGEEDAEAKEAAAEARAEAAAAAATAAAAAAAEAELMFPLPCHVSTLRAAFRHGVRCGEWEATEALLPTAIDRATRRLDAEFAPPDQGSSAISAPNSPNRPGSVRGSAISAPKVAESVRGSIKGSVVASGVGGASRAHTARSWATRSIGQSSAFGDERAEADAAPLEEEVVEAEAEDAMAEVTDSTPASH